MTEKTEVGNEVPTQKSPQDINKELQGKKKVSKKKIKGYTKRDCLDEIQRLERAGHQASVYYKAVKSKALSLP